MAIVKRGPISAWLGVWHAYEGEGYGIHEWPSGRYIDNLGGGGCDTCATLANLITITNISAFSSMFQRSAR